MERGWTCKYLAVVYLKVAKYTMASPQCKQGFGLNIIADATMWTEVLLHKRTYPDYQLQCSIKRGNHVWAAREGKKIQVNWKSASTKLEMSVDMKRTAGLCWCTTVLLQIQSQKIYISVYVDHECCELLSTRATWIIRSCSVKLNLVLKRKNYWPFLKNTCQPGTNSKWENINKPKQCGSTFTSCLFCVFLFFLR